MNKSNKLNWKTRTILLVTAAIFGLAASVVKAHAQGNTLIVASASSSGTYDSMLKEISKVCSTPDTGLTIEKADVKGGATDNLAALMNNEASAAFMHGDVIYAMSMGDESYRQLYTLVALYPEEVHVIAKIESGLTAGGSRIGNFGAKPVTFNTLSDLRGYKIGAAGGGYLTAKVLKASADIGFEPVQLDSGADLLPALDNNTVQAVIVVGGAPLKFVKDLPAGRYKLLSVGEDIRGKVSGTYRSATLTYPNLRATNVHTIAPDAIILTRKYTTTKMQEPQRKFRDCFYEHLDELKETPKLHPKWRQVEASNHGKWQWYELPSNTGPATSTTDTSPTLRPRQARKPKQ